MTKKPRTASSASASGDDNAETPPALPNFPIVGIGASAGGLEAFLAFLNHLPPDTGMGFVLVQHLDPEHESALVQLLSRATSLPVQEVTNNLRVEPNHVYVIPPNANLSISGGVLRLGPRPKARAPHRSIDFFLEALAEDRRERAIGVILSGTATDGTLGLEAIKAEGGITFAQDDSARYDSMPRSAVTAGCVDFVLSPEGIAKEIARIAKHPAVAGGSLTDTRVEADAGDEAPLPSTGRAAPDTGAERARAEANRDEPVRGEEAFRKILLLLRNHSGVDFSLYKSSTIRRRINRRIVLSRQNSLDDYARFLRGNTGELDALYSDVLISVTSFFRNAETFDIIQRKIFPALLQQRSDVPVRVWVLGCSTGQEAYSMAISFVEAADKVSHARKLQAFATDLNDTLLDKARSGLYAKSLAHDLSPERLRRFFVEEEGGYRVNKLLREMVVFARQNVIDDPPFSRMDLISCRNLLIYLEPGLQKKLLPVFHYALNPGGFLCLGASESAAGFTDLFELVDKKHRLYAKKAAPTPPFQLPARVHGESHALPRRRTDIPFRTTIEQLGIAEGVRAEVSAQREADRIAVNQFAPPGVLINANLQVLQFRGATSAYFTPPPGKATFDVLKIARPGLMLPLRTLIDKVKKDNQTARKENVTVEQDGTPSRTIHVEVIPLRNLREPCFLIVFEDADRPRRRPSPQLQPRSERMGRGARSRRIAELETELAETRDYLQSMQEQQEAANEELQASNEEVQSANEELQSINEELETSKEELESANEELMTVNEEMATHNAELNRLNSDLVNIQTSAQLAIVLVSRDLTVRRFNPQAEKQFNLIAADVGRPISHVRHQLDLADLDGFVMDVVDTMRAQEKEVQDKDGRWYSLRADPYVTSDNRVDGAVLVLVDIDAIKRGEQAVRESEERFRTLVAQVKDYAIFRTDIEGRATTWNEGVRRILGFAEHEFVGTDISGEIFTEEDVRAGIPQKDLDEAARTGQADNTRWMRRKDGGRFFAVGVTTALKDAKGELLGFSKVLHDQTERRETEEARDRLARIVESSDDAIIGSDVNGNITTWNRGAERLLGYTAEEAVNQPTTMLIPAERTDEERTLLKAIVRDGSIDSYETIRRGKDGRLLDVWATVSPVKDRSGRLIGVSRILRDISPRKRAEEALRQGHGELQVRADELARFNEAAVGRELRMIELKRQVNELRERLGEPRTYPLEFDRDPEGESG